VPLDHENLTQTGSQQSPQRQPPVSLVSVLAASDLKQTTGG
jgi:hypothetical protein